MPDKPLTPEEILKSMHSAYLEEEKALREANMQAHRATERMKRGKRFIGQICKTWSLPNPLALGDEAKAVVPGHPRPGGITVVTDQKCAEPNCGRTFPTVPGLNLHRNRASCEILGPGHGKSCLNHYGKW